MTWALIGTTLALGLRHGVDLDHLAAIGDITGSETRARSGLWLSFLYALGHGVVVFILGVIAIALGDLIPDTLDAAMSKVVGLTLVILGAYVLYSLLRNGRDFRLQSRWMLVYGAARRAVGWLSRRRRVDLIEIVHDHDHAHYAEHDHSHDPQEEPGGTRSQLIVMTTAHSHSHRHVLPLPEDPFAAYSSKAALTVGAIHGIGAETPTQVLLFLSAAGIGGGGAGVALLLSFLAGLIISNMAVATLSTWGFRRAAGTFPLYAALGALTATFSVAFGAFLLWP